MPESGARGGCDGTKRRNGSKAHVAVDTLRLLLALHDEAVDEQDRAQTETLAAYRNHREGHKAGLR